MYWSSSMYNWTSKMTRKIITVALWLLLHTDVGRAKSTPTVYWSMDHVDGIELIPDIGNTDFYTATIYQLGGVDNHPGVFGEGLSIESSEVTVGYFQPPVSSCFTNPDGCNGISVGVWLNIRRRGSGPNNCIFTSASKCSVNQPGVSIFLQPNKNNTLFVVVRLLEGTFYTAGCDIVYETWTNILVTWNQQLGVKVFLNYTEASYTSSPKRHSGDRQGESIKIRIGSTEPNYLIWIDELKLWNFSLSPKEILQQEQDTEPSSSTQPRPPTTLVEITTSNLTSHVTNVPTTTQLTATLNTVPESMVHSTSQSTADNTVYFATSTRNTEQHTLPTVTSGTSHGSSTTYDATTGMPDENLLIVHRPLFWLLIVAAVFVLVVVAIRVFFICKRKRQLPDPQEHLAVEQQPTPHPFFTGERERRMFRVAESPADSPLLLHEQTPL